MNGGEVCVYCRKRPVVARFRPFCSERCRLLDLAAWADGRYRVAGSPVSVPDACEPPDTDDEH
jgi:endogenous inhibitor of DNA gyrase (YacG/DUF329 family)